MILATLMLRFTQYGSICVVKLKRINKNLIYLVSITLKCLNVVPGRFCDGGQCSRCGIHDL